MTPAQVQVSLDAKRCAATVAGTIILPRQASGASHADGAREIGCEAFFEDGPETPEAPETPATPENPATPETPDDDKSTVGYSPLTGP